MKLFSNDKIISSHNFEKLKLFYPDKIFNDYICKDCDTLLLEYADGRYDLLGTDLDFREKTCAELILRRVME